ncbi:lecithin retinol acyltransferase-like, partial [Hemitrygon akajei]|uniref:lecithin retinol acyltransferase-like n=1 Tax=Hemitrygon akajei TaxID=2704970 RepID=UPI003BF95C86
HFQPSPHPQPGDLIQILRSGYKHWAIYIGGGDVVHLTSDGASVGVSYGYSSSTAIAVVKRKHFATVIGDDRWRINNNSDRIWRPLPADEIAERAISKIGIRMPYKVLEANCEHFVNLVRYGINISYQPSPHPQPGDLIQIFRSVYKHWAIYIGGGDVVHLTSDGATVDVSYGYSSSTAIAVVKKQPLDTVVGNDRWCINNKSDKILEPFPPDEIVERAISKIGKRKRYKLLEANCEHFVNFVRYGINISYQKSDYQFIGLTDVGCKAVVAVTPLNQLIYLTVVGLLGAR